MPSAYAREPLNACCVCPLPARSGAHDVAQLLRSLFGAGAELPDPYCEASLLGAPSAGRVYLTNPSSTRWRANLSVHASSDGGRTWPQSRVLYAGGASASTHAKPSHRLQSTPCQLAPSNLTHLAIGSSYAAGAAYSDTSWTREGELAFLFEKDNYQSIAFGTVDFSVEAR